MQFIDNNLLKQLFPTVSAQKREIFLPFINLAMARFSINTERRVAMFCAQVGHESNNLAVWVENLNYSAKRMTQVFPNRFPTVAAAQPFANNPRAFANKVYGGRMGNRSGTDDGFNFRGRSPMQATGREMYQTLTRIFGKEFRADFVLDPDLLLNPAFGFMASAAIFADVKGCNPLSDAGQVVGVTKRINGGTNGLADRVARYERNLRILPDGFKLLSYDDMKAKFGDAPVADTPLIQNSTFDFDNKFDTVKDEPEQATEVSDASDNADAPKTEIEIGGGKVNVKTDAPKDAPPEKVAIVKEPNLFQYIKTEITGFLGGNLSLDAATQKAGEVQALGLPYSFWSKVIYFALAATAIYFVVKIYRHYQAKQTTSILVKANTTENNTVILVDEKDIAARQAEGFKIITR